jgi:signal transduction histidine kinase
MKNVFKNLLVAFILLLSILSYIYYEKTRQIALENAEVKINELLLNYKAFRSYVSNIQKEEVYRLQQNNKISCDYFMPQLLSSTYSAKAVNELYNQLRQNKKQEEIKIRFASDNPRNLNNKATPDESAILKQFNEGTLSSYKKIIETDKGKSLYYAVPTKRTTKECMRCHYDPKTAPKQMVEVYGDKNGFYEKQGQVRALLSTSYPLTEDLNYANSLFFKLVLVSVIVFGLLFVIVYYFVKRLKIKNSKLQKLNLTLDRKVEFRTKELEKERKYIKSIVDANPNVIVVTSGKDIISANKSFFELLGYEDIKKFKKEHKCICDYFVKLDEKEFNDKQLIQGQTWCDYLVEHNENIHHLEMMINGRKVSYIISAIPLNGSDHTLLTLSDITELKEKDKKLYEQSKLASMGEMIGNIAHHWRQPLSVISTGATGLKVHKEFNTLSDQMFFETCDLIESNAQYLSKTIDDFRNFIREDRIKKKFQIKESIDNLLKLTGFSATSHHINVEIKIEESIEVESYPNELAQCFINVFNNAKDALKLVPEEQRYLLIEAKKLNGKVQIIFSDTGGGIDEKIINSIFEPYFTTKHQSKGTGLGLSMTYKLITEGMGGNITVKNGSLKYKGKEYKGAVFTITL